jgi:hypothetical protein
MNNLDIVLALFITPNHRFSRLDTTAAFQAATLKCNFKLGSPQLFPNIKPMSSTTNYLYYHLFEGVCFGRRRRRVAVLKS